MRTDRAVNKKLKKVGAQHIPVVIVVGVAFVAAHHKAADAAMGQQCLVHRQVGQIGFDRGALLGIQRLAGLQRVQSRRRVTRVVGEWIGRQAWWQVVAHVFTLRERHR